MLKTKPIIATPYVKVLRNGQITLPRKYRRVLGIDEGHILEIILEKSKVILKPKVLTDKESILSPQGELKIREALEDIKKGRVSKVYDNVDELMKDLNS